MCGVELLSKQVGRERGKTTHNTHTYTHTHQDGRKKGVDGRGRGRKEKKRGGVKEEVRK